MKFEKRIRTQLVIAGCAAALLFAGAAKAQEIENTTFDDGPNVAAFTQPVPLQDASYAPAIPVLPSSQASRAVLAANASSNTIARVSAPAQQANVEQEPSADMMWTGVVLVSIVAAGLYASGSGKRLTRELRSLRNSHAPTRGV